MIPYFISLLVLGIPLCWAEWTMGRYGGSRGFNSAPGIYATIWPRPAAKYLGAIALLVPLVIYMYYVLIEAWCLGYAFNYLTGDLMVGSGGEIDRLVSDLKANGADPATATSEAYQAFFANFVGSKQDGFVMGAGGYGGRWQWVLAGVFLFNFALIYRGVTRGIERFCRIAMPLMAVLAVIVLVRVLTLGTPDAAKPEQSVLGGLNYMWEPDFEALKRPSTWLAASGQIFFTLVRRLRHHHQLRQLPAADRRRRLERLDVQQRERILRSLPRRTDHVAGGVHLPRSVDERVHRFDVLPRLSRDSQCVQPHVGRAAVRIPVVLRALHRRDHQQRLDAPTGDRFSGRRIRAQAPASASILGLITAAGVLFTLYFSKGLVALDTLDFWVGSVMILVLALVQSLLYGWALGIERGEEEAHAGAHLRIPRFVQYMLKYVVPLYLIIILGAFIYNDVPARARGIWATPVALGSIIFISVILGFLLLMVRMAGKRWARAGRL